jgi:hypothetical protein
MTTSAILSRAREAVLVLGCALLVSCCAVSHGTAQPTLKESEIVGTWSNHKGSTISFQANGRFSVVDMNFGALSYGCSNVSGPGYWEFLSADGDSPSTGVTYTSGNQIGLSFDGQNDSCNVTLTSWEIDPPVGLCLDFDPDSPCTGSPWTKVR